MEDKSSSNNAGNDPTRTPWETPKLLIEGTSITSGGPGGPKTWGDDGGTYFS